MPSWRLPLDESYSDFVIAVSVEPEEAANNAEQNSTTEYHVHKERLCVGPRRSDVLARAIRAPMAEATRNRYCVDLKRSAADAFPILLDYLYTGKIKFHCVRDYLYGDDNGADDDTMITVSSKQCVALRFLSSYFGMELLQHEIDEYIGGYHFLESVEDLSCVWEESAVYHDEKMRDILKKKAIQLLDDCVDRSSSRLVSVLGDFLSLVPFGLIQCVWVSWVAKFLDKEGRVGGEERVDILVEAAKGRRFDIDDKVMALVTSQSSLPKLTTSAAMKLLQMISDQSTCAEGTGDFDAKMKDLERRCADVAAEDWENALDLQPWHWRDLEDDDRRSKKRQKIETSCKQLSVEIERNLLRCVVAKATDDVSCAKKEASERLWQYIDLGQGLQDQEMIMSWPKHSLFVFGNTGASGCYRLYSYELEGIAKKYRNQRRYQYNDYGHSDDRGWCTLEYDKTKSCWKIWVQYRKTHEKGNEGESRRLQQEVRVQQVLFEAPKQNGSTEIPKLGWKDAITGEDRPDILVLEFETLRQSHNPSFSYDSNTRPYDPHWRP